MTEQKEFYFSPEVEVICFAPIESLASDSWGWSTWGFGTGETPDSVSDTNVETGVTDPSGDVDEGDM